MSSNRETQAKFGAVSPTGSSRKRILIVEDNSLNRLMLEDYLGFCGYQVLSLPTADKFFEEIARFQPDLILLDLKLPGIDGYTLLEQLKAKPNLQHIPVIIVSAFAFRMDRQRAFNLGACRYFIKPVDLTELKTAIYDQLSHELKD
ncbi:response regulator [Aliterella atlantica]|uniref:response regulator n=1 Tax=Aliterella atlantica TaxID=1827278 RepID=UPI0005D35BA7|nr:response regulator [Aliterella atlantica]